MQKVSVLLSSFFGAGFSPIAPGTVGSAFALFLFCILPERSIEIDIVGIALTTVLGAYAIQSVQKMEGIEDDGRFVIDEAVGVWISVLGFPIEWPWMLAGFFLFRFYDIVKPYPARQIDEKLKGGWGVMADDLVAGIYALCTLHFLWALKVFL